MKYLQTLTMLQEENSVRKEKISDPMNSHLHHCNCPEALPS